MRHRTTAQAPRKKDRYQMNKPVKQTPKPAPPPPGARAPANQAGRDDLLRSLQSVDYHNHGTVTKQHITEILHKNGLNEDDPRLRATFDALSAYADTEEIEITELARKVCNNNHLLTRALRGELILPQFHLFTEKVKEIVGAVRKNKGGKVADYIPQLAKVDPEKLAVSICTVDGQFFSIGDYADNYCLQSTCKPLLYALALDECGAEKVHRHIGREPSGVSFNDLALNRHGLPHNPMINSGAIMSCSLIKPQLAIAERFEYVMTQISAMAGDHHAVGFDNSVYLSEKETGDRNYALGYFMREKGAFPENTDLLKTLEFYFQCCSVQTTVRGFAGIAATLANAGINPTSGAKVLKPGAVKNCLSLMHTCGMYDYSGEWAFLVGVPAKSGVSGALQVIIPGVMGISVWSPPLDAQGNTVRGVAFVKQLINNYNFHNYDSVVQHECGKIDPRVRAPETTAGDTFLLLQAAAAGDLSEIMLLAAKGADLDAADYDGRTALHLAASEGRVDALEYLIHKGVNLKPVDRWNNTPLDDARRHGHAETGQRLKHHGA